MKVTVEKPSSYQRILKIEVPAETVTAEIENLYTKLKETATHPGFRKGKVPRKILERKFGKSIRKDALESTVSSSLKAALEEHKLTPLTDPDFGEVKFDDGGPLTFEATIEVEPAVELAEYKGIELKKPKATVTDEDVAKVLERLRISHAKLIPVERSVEKSDIVTLDFEGFKNDKPLKDMKAEDFPLEVGSKALGEEFENQLLGMKAHEKKQIAVKYPEDFRTKELAGSEIVFKVTLKEVKLRELPPLDDEFAKQLEKPTLEELKQHIRENLKKDLEKRIEQFLREQALLKIVNESKVEIPPKLRSRVAAAVFEEEIRRLVYRGVDREAITAERDKISGFADAEAGRRLKVDFVTDEIAKRENLSISNEELDKSLEETIKESEARDPRVRSYLSSERVRERYREQLRVQKILDFIVSNAKIEEVDKFDFGQDAGSDAVKEGAEPQPGPIVDTQKGES